MCIGNGFNDISMFKQAIDDDMIAAVMEESSFLLKKETIDYTNNKNKGRVVIVPRDKNKANEFMLRYAKIFQKNIRENRIFGNKKKYSISSKQLNKNRKGNTNRKIKDFER